MICDTSILPADYYKVNTCAHYTLYYEKSTLSMLIFLIFLVSQRTVINEADFQAVTIDALGIHALYVMLDKPDLRYSKGKETGSISSSNSDLSILEGKGVAGSFERFYTPRIFNGFVKYHVIDSMEPSIQTVNTIEDSFTLTTNFDGKNGNHGIM